MQTEEEAGLEPQMLGSPTVQGIGKATAAPVKLDGWERLLLEKKE